MHMRQEIKTKEKEKRKLQPVPFIISTHETSWNIKIFRKDIRNFKVNSIIQFSLWIIPPKLIDFWNFCYFTGSLLYTINLNTFFFNSEI